MLFLKQDVCNNVIMIDSISNVKGAGREDAATRAGDVSGHDG